MAEIIAGIYEIERELGHGGGGIAYLGRHLRLNKPVVLKADKRTLNTRAEALRREVDLLKGLSHTYIPQVYDFVQQNGVVYTVMDYIEGESLDKLLERGELPAQPQVIGWAVELLEALCYLHRQPPHGILHGDIKPSNIMLRPNGDICLIDYNIALALGEDGAVKVGSSRGYSSPEHYGSQPSYGQSFPGQTAHGTPSGGQLSGGQPSNGKGMESTVLDTEPGNTDTETFCAREDFRDTETENTDTETFCNQETLCDTEAIGGMDAFGDTGAESFQSRAAGARFSVQPASFRSSSGIHGKNPVILDVRSDIYSLGATLYHLLSGVRPDADAGKVKPLGPEICSPAVSAIIRKAMATEPKKRYQTAEEMLQAFRSLHKRDARMVRHKRRERLTAAALTALFLFGGGCTFVGLKQMEQRQEALALSEYSAGRLAEGDVTEAVRLALEAIPKDGSILEGEATAEAQKALTDALGVYELSGGFEALDAVKLPSAPLGMETSPAGSRFVVLTLGEASVFEMESGACLAKLPLVDSAMAEAVFVSEDLLLYGGKDGLTAYDIPKKQTVWTGKEATALSLSGDKTVVCAVNRSEEQAVLYRTADGTELGTCSFEGRHMAVAENDIFANPNDSLLALNEDGSRMAVSFSDGALWICNWKNREEDLILYEESEYRHFEGGFCGPYFAFAASGGGKSQFGLVDVEAAELFGAMESEDRFFLKADSRGIFLANGNLLVSLAPDTLEETELAYTEQEMLTGFSVDGKYVLTATDRPGFSIFDGGANRILEEESREPCEFLCLSGKYALIGNRNEPVVRRMKLENHEDAILLTYDARFPHEEARISKDKKTVMLFDYEHFQIYGMDGTMLAQGSFPNPDQIYDQQFETEGDASFLRVLWYDGTSRWYSASDGGLWKETTEEKPDRSLEEEFLTADYRIVSPLHGAPQVYDRESGKFLKALEEDSYLTYVTEEGEFLITEYIRASGERYGLLLNERLETLAYLPKLCDVRDGMLLFDDGAGNLRQSRLYSLPELMALGEND